MDNDRPIEKLLRRFAKKRRDESGAPTLHPATRRLLQGEVARQFGRTKRSGAEGFWSRIRPRFVFIACILVVTGLTAALLLPSLSSSKSKSMKLSSNRQMEMARMESDTREIESLKDLPANSAAPAVTPPPAASTPPASPAPKAAREPALNREEAFNENTPAKNKTALDDESARHQVKAEKPVALTGASSSVTYALPAASAPALIIVTNGRSDGGADRKLVMTDTVAVGSLAKTDGFIAGADTSFAAGGALFSNQSSLDKVREWSATGNYSLNNQSQRYMNSFSASQSAKELGLAQQLVLSSFQMEQDGDQLRVVDNDGSTYSGTIQPAVYEKASGTAVHAGKTRDTANQLSFHATNALFPNDNAFFFRVTGTNRTLKQRIVFSGNLLTGTHLTLSQSVAGALSSPPASSINNAAVQNGSSQQFFNLLQNSSIAGKADVGGGQMIEINAQPVNPSPVTRP